MAFILAWTKYFFCDEKSRTLAASPRSRDASFASSAAFMLRKRLARRMANSKSTSTPAVLPVLEGPELDSDVLKVDHAALAVAGPGVGIGLGLGVGPASSPETLSAGNGPGN